MGEKQVEKRRKYESANDEKDLHEKKRGRRNYEVFYAFY